MRRIRAAVDVIIAVEGRRLSAFEEMKAIREMLQPAIRRVHAVKRDRRMTIVLADVTHVTLIPPLKTY